eukprot:Phypoly_transcript_04521.p1 GENE.Phypoly_transcript_04521~~Phypoly_transcript_04521.p1  ORF type:complete len:618 (+),score=33.36 Phypoly_transcript_04521:251-2104(+)
MITLYSRRQPIFLLAFVALLFATHVRGQQCLTFDPSAAPASGAVCLPYVSKLVWLPLILNAISEVDNVFNSTILYQITAVQSILSVNCYDALLSLLCNAAFPPCNYTLVDTTQIPVSYPGCRSACTHTNEICSYFFGLYDQTPLNCSQTDIITNEDQWPVEYHLNNYFGFVKINTTCTKEFPRGNNTPKRMTCPYPLNPVDHIDETKPPCYIPCPDPTWTPKEWHDIGIVEFSFALLSFILMIFISIHYIADPKCRNTTRRFQLYSYISQLLFALAFVMPGPFPQSTWCANSTTFATSSNPACGTQAFLFVVFGLSSSFWWAISSSIMFRQLENPNYRISRRKELLYWAIALGVPIIPFIIGVRLGVVTFYWLTPFCFIQYLIGDTTLDYHYILFYIPLCIPMLVAMGFIIGTVYKITKHSLSMKATFKGQEQTSGISLLKVNVRLLVWCACLFMFFFTIIIYRSVLEKKWAPLQNAAYAWGVCKVKSELGVGTDQDCPESKFPEPLNYPGTVVHYIVTTSLGTLSFLAFGTTKQVFYFWRYIVGFVRRREWAELRDLLTNEKTFAALRMRDLRNTVQAPISLDTLKRSSKTSTTDRSSSLDSTADKLNIESSDTTV